MLSGFLCICRLDERDKKKYILEVSQAMQGGHYAGTTNHIPFRLDPRNPFDNPTENRDYNLDYSDILPPITAPGYELPVLPAKLERANIRRFYNLGGGILLLHLVATNVIATILYTIFPLVLSGVDRHLNGTLPDNYDSIVSSYISNSSCPWR